MEMEWKQYRCSLFSNSLAGTSIKGFMAFYCQTSPQASILPKMHMLEEYVLPFMRKWRVGCGFIGEQGAESIHKYFNLLERTYSSIPDRLARLKQKVVEHYLHTAPILVESCPVPTNRRRKTSKDHSNS